MTFDFTLDQERRHLVIAPGSTEIPAQAFQGSVLFDTVSIPDSVEVIGNSAFASTSLKEVDIPDSVKKIEEWAFYWNQDLSMFRKEPSKIFAC